MNKDKSSYGWWLTVSALFGGPIIALILPLFGVEYEQFLEFLRRVLGVDE